MRLNRGGNRQLNRALHVIAVSQARFHPEAKAYVTRRIEVDGKTWREAIRALKRRLVRPVYRLLLEGSNLQLAEPLDEIGAWASWPIRATRYTVGLRGQFTCG
jgi:Transposase IS116/IS110/IS902 family